eukprot:TRINITY_DN1855_c0_g1_i1.p1 TRINITY_DN1855_c0_g1~~TRINITY_DN1855_c0_g1_i1.p1  ORF type:complete len:205 (-),score=30.79 TRINITY_DN1855_c0_g1_i1:155-736(-)
MGKGKETPLHKIIIVGSGGVGKSALTLQFMYGDFYEEYDPTSADSYRKTVTIDEEEINVDILDTAGQEDYAAMRDNYYRTGEGFMCVYAITLEDSFEKLENFFEQIIRVTDKDNIPFVLVGNKSDLESDRQVDSMRGEELSAKYECTFMETSAKTNTNVENAFFTLVKEVIKSKSNSSNNSGGGDKKGKCVIL